MTKGKRRRFEIQYGTRPQKGYIVVDRETDEVVFESHSKVEALTHANILNRPLGFEDRWEK